MPYPDLPHIENHRGIMSALECNPDPFEYFKGDLVKACEVMRKFCSVINLAAATQCRISPEVNLNTMAAVIYRLLQRSYEGSSVEEALRLGLLAFCSHVFLRWQNVGLPYNHLSTRHRRCLAELSASPEACPRTLLWLLTIGAISMSTELNAEWWNSSLRHSIELCGVSSWAEMRQTLKSFLWIDVLHDQLGKKLYELALS